MISLYVRGIFKDENGRTIADVDSWLTPDEFVDILKKAADVSYDIADYDGAYAFDRAVLNSGDADKITDADALSEPDLELCRAWHDATCYPVVDVDDYLSAAAEAFVWQGGSLEEFGGYVADEYHHGEVPDFLKGYIDYEALGEAEASCYTDAKIDGTIYLFHAC